MEVIIRKAKSEDLVEIIRIQKSAFKVQADRYDAYDIPPMIEKAEDIDLFSENLAVLVAELDGSIAGSVRIGYGEKDAEIKRLSVNDEYQNKGIGKRLIWQTKCKLQKHS